MSRRLSVLDGEVVWDVERARLWLIGPLLWLVAERLLSATFVLRGRPFVILIDDHVVCDASGLHVGFDVLVGLA